MIKSRALTAVALAACIALFGAAACSSKKPAPSASDQTGGGETMTPDPCQLVTADEVSKALGDTFKNTKPAQPGGLPGQRTCLYEKPDATSLVSVAIWPGDQVMFDAFKAQAGTVSDISGVGEAAYGGPPALWMLDKGWIVTVTVAFVDVKSADAVSSIAKSAAGRL